MTKQPQQQSTKDYSRFRWHPQNRIVINADGNPIPRKDLIDSMKRDGFLKEYAIKVYEDPDKKYTIFDGHNRLVAAMSLDLPVEYIAYPRNGKVLTPVQYSRNQKSWTMDQYIRSYALAGKEDYIELVEFAEKNGIGLSAAGCLLNGQVAPSGNANESLKAGTWKVKDRVYAELVVSIVRVIAQFKPFATKRQYLTAVSQCVRAKGFSVERMKEKIERYPELIEKVRTADDALVILDAMYNRNFRGERYELVVETKKAMRERAILPPARDRE